MTEATARAQLERMLAWDQRPALTSDEVTALLTSARRVDSDGLWVSDDTSWVALTVVTLNTRRAPLTRNGHAYLATTAGTTGATEPAFPTTSGATITDGTVVWTEAGSSWIPTHDLNAAASEGWNWKAAKVTGSFDFATDGQTFDRSQMVDMCLQMAERYRKRIFGTIRVGSGLPIIAPAIVLIPTEEAFLP